MMVGAPGKWGSTTGVCEGVARGVEEAGKLIMLVVRGRVRSRASWVAGSSRSETSGRIVVESVSWAEFGWRDDESGQLREHRGLRPGSHMDKPSTIRGNHRHWFSSARGVVAPVTG